MANDNWSPFYPTVFYPAQESTSLQRKMLGDLQTIVRDLSRFGQSQPQNQIVRSQPQTLIVQQDPDAAYRAIMMANELQDSWSRETSGLRDELADLSSQIGNEFADLSSQIEWGVELLHESIVEQTGILLTIAEQQRIPNELKVREYLTGALEMVSQLASSIQSGRLDQNQTEQLFTAIDSRLLEAMNPKPRASLMYAILLARAELYLLVKKYNEALVFLEEGLIYAPKEGSFDYISYSCRLIGRIVFARGDTFEVVHKAISYLVQAVKHSPDYAIAWYDLAQYSAQLSGDSDTDPALRHLRKAIELGPNFLVLASIEPNFNPIRKEVDELIETILQEKATELKRRADEEAADLKKRTDEIRKSHLEACAVQGAKIQRINQIFGSSHVFWKKQDLVNELDWRLHGIGYWGIKNALNDLLLSARVPEITSIPERVTACANIEALQCLSGEIADLGRTCDKLLSPLEAFEALLKALPMLASGHLKYCNKEIEKYDAILAANKGRKEPLSTTDGNIRAGLSNDIEVINKTLHELETIFAASP